MTKQEHYKQVLETKSLVDYINVGKVHLDVKKEVFNPKSSHFLDFDHFIEDENSPRGLITETDITHGFYMNGNDRVYLPADLMDAISTITTPHAKPIKMGHGSGEVIGRAMDAKWVNDFQKYGALPFKIQEALQGRATWDSCQKAIRDMLRSSLADSVSYSGVGAIRARGIISDAVSIEKILDERMLTVSIEMGTNDLINPITGNSWMIDLYEVDYTPGEVVDGMKVPMVTDGLRINGWAYVTHPADPHATTVNNELMDQIQQYVDSIKTPFFIFDSIPTFNVETQFVEADLDVPEYCRKGATVILEDANKRTKISASTYSLSKKIKDNCMSEADWLQVNERLGFLEQSIKQCEDNYDEKLLIEYRALGGSVMKQKSRKIEDSSVLSIKWTEAETEEIVLESLYDDKYWESLAKESDINIDDARRKAKLYSSYGVEYFAGPNKSFPVIDEAHAKASLELLDRTTLLSNKTKEKIKTCLRKKLQVK